MTTTQQTQAPRIDYARHMANGRRLRSEAVLMMFQTARAWFGQHSQTLRDDKTGADCRDDALAACA